MKTLTCSSSKLAIEDNLVFNPMDRTCPGPNKSYQQDSLYNISYKSSIRKRGKSYILWALRRRISRVIPVMVKWGSDEHIASAKDSLKFYLNSEEEYCYYHNVDIELDSESCNSFHKAAGPFWVPISYAKRASVEPSQSRKTAQREPTVNQKTLQAYHRLAVPWKSLAPQNG